MEDVQEIIDLLNSIASLILSTIAILAVSKTKKNTSKKKRSRKRK